jgi:KEOPS complex subunit Pcc1
MEHNAVFRFTGAAAEAVYRAVAPEMAGEINPRSCAECWIEPSGTLVLSVGASDISALRASLNMWLRLINVAMEMQELTTGQCGSIL